MTRDEQNIKIAKILGFKPYLIRAHDEGKVHSKYWGWTYPKEYEHMVSQSPETTVPDFVQMIENWSTLPGMHAPSDFNSFRKSEITKEDHAVVSG